VVNAVRHVLSLVGAGPVGVAAGADEAGVVVVVVGVVVVGVVVVGVVGAAHVDCACDRSADSWDWSVAAFA